MRGGMGPSYPPSPLERSKIKFWVCGVENFFFCAPFGLDRFFFLLVVRCTRYDVLKATSVMTYQVPGISYYRTALYFVFCVLFFPGIFLHSRVFFWSLSCDYRPQEPSRNLSFFSRSVNVRTPTTSLSLSRNSDHCA